VTGEKSSADLQDDMVHTREAISEKVAALESQVLGTIQSAADTVTNTVDAVKEAVAAAPSAVSETMKQTVAAVKESVSSFRVLGCVDSHPWASMGTAVLAGFFLGRRSSSGPARRVTAPMAAASVAAAPVTAAARKPGLVSEVCGMAGRELRQLAEEAIRSFAQTAKQTIQSRMPEVVDAAIHQWTDSAPEREAATRLRRDRVSVNSV